VKEFGKSASRPIFVEVMCRLRWLTFWPTLYILISCNDDDDDDDDNCDNNIFLEIIIRLTTH